MLGLAKILNFWEKIYATLQGTKAEFKETKTKIKNTNERLTTLGVKIYRNAIIFGRTNTDIKTVNKNKIFETK